MGLLAVALLCASRVVITEVMANPAGGTGALAPEDRNEFVELYNPTSHPVDLCDWALDDGDAVDWLCPWADSSLLADNPTLQLGHTWLRPGGYAVILDSEYCAAGAQGGFIRPYRFPDSTLILTTRNTTLGNGLAATDPVAIASAYGDTSTFGTPLDNSDSLPCDPGDGVSWERLDPLGPDTVTNWAACLDSSGATPGRPASALEYCDFAVTALILADTAPLRSGEPATAAATVANQGLRPVGDWSATAWLDLDSDGEQGPGEPAVLSLAGSPLAPGADTAFSFEFTCPNRPTDLWLELSVARDPDSADNRRRITVGPGTGRLLELARARLSPDNDQVEDTLEIRFHLPGANGWLTIDVFDLRGRRVRRVLEGRAGEAHGGVAWDGRRTDGTLCPAGIYAVKLGYRFEGSTIESRLPFVLAR